MSMLQVAHSATVRALSLSLSLPCPLDFSVWVVRLYCVCVVYFCIFSEKWNQALTDVSTIAGGEKNLIGRDARGAAIAGGAKNRVQGPYVSCMSATGPSSSFAELVSLVCPSSGGDGPWWSNCSIDCLSGDAAAAAVVMLASVSSAAGSTTRFLASILLQWDQKQLSPKITPV